MGLLALATVLGSGSAMAQSRAHVYLFRGLADVYSLGMNTLAEELTKRGVYATAHSHTEWKSIADRAAANYKAGREGPIILVGHSLGADAVMEMADYLGDKGVPVALVVPFDGTQSFPAPGNVGRVINFTQRDYAYMRPGPGFHGTLLNIDLSSDPTLSHFNIDESPRLHARVISEVLAIVGGHGGAVSSPANKPPPIGAPGASSSSDRAIKTTPADESKSATPAAPANSDDRRPMPPQKPAVAPQRVDPAEIPD